MLITLCFTSTTQNIIFFLLTHNSTTVDRRGAVFFSWNNSHSTSFVRLLRITLLHSAIQNSFIIALYYNALNFFVFITFFHLPSYISFQQQHLLSFLKNIYIPHASSCYCSCSNRASLSKFMRLKAIFYISGQQITIQL